MSAAHSVLVHAFKLDPHSPDLTNPGTTYCDPWEEPERVAGWTAYVRTETGAEGAFEIVEEHDTATRDGALICAEHLARKWATTSIEEY